MTQNREWSIDPSHHLAFGAIGKKKTADNVELPQRHRRLAHPADVIPALTPPPTRLNQAVTAQDACTVDFPGGVLPSGALPASSKAIRRGPHQGCSRRSSHTRLSISASA